MSWLEYTRLREGRVLSGGDGGGGVDDRTVYVLGREVECCSSCAKMEAPVRTQRGARL